VGKETDLKFRIDLIEEFLIKQSNDHRVPGHWWYDNTVKRLTKWHFLGRIPATEKVIETIK
jgi:hypothetical protein